MTLSDLQTLCAEIRQVLPNAIIGGGACRDAYFGKPIKDIDVFVDVPDLPDSLKTLATHMGGTADLGGSSGPLDCPQGGVLFTDGRIELNVVNRQGVDIIDDIHDYDFGLSQIAVTPSGVIMTPKFVEDATRMGITYTHADDDRPRWHRESSAKRLTRLVQKYPNFSPRRTEVLDAINEAVTFE